MLSASKRASKLSSKDPPVDASRTRQKWRDAKDSASEVFRQRVRAHVEAKPEEADRLGLRVDRTKSRRRDRGDGDGRVKV
jgi:hypothetical protein